MGETHGRGATWISQPRRSRSWYVSAAASIGEKTKTFGLTGAIRYQIPMLRRAVRVAILVSGLVVLAACAPAPRPSSPRVTPPPETSPTSPPLVPTVVVLPTPTPAPLGRQTQDPTAVVVFAPSLFGQVLADLGSDFMLAAPQAT